MDANPSELVLIRAGRTPGEKRRSWHASRLSDDIQRSVSRSSWPPLSDGLAYQQREMDDKEEQLQDRQVEISVAPPPTSGARFSIAPWVDVHSKMENAIVIRNNGSSYEYEDPAFSSDEEEVFVQQEQSPVVALSFTLAEVPETPYNKRIVSSVSDQYFDGVVRELRGVIF